MRRFVLPSWAVLQQPSRPRRRAESAARSRSGGTPARPGRPSPPAGRRRTNAPIKPASTVPTPAAGDGTRFATIPTKKPWTTTPNGTSTPNAWKPPTGSRCCPPRSRSRRRRTRARAAGCACGRSRCARRSPASRAAPPARAATLREPRVALEAVDPALDVARDQRDQPQQQDRAAGDRRGHDRHRQGSSPGSTLGAQQHAEDDQREQVDRVQDHEERDHPAGRPAPRHAGLAQRPVGQRDAARAGGREQRRRRQRGQRDLARGTRMSSRARTRPRARACRSRRDEHGVRAVDHERHAERDDDPVPASPRRAGRTRPRARRPSGRRRRSRRSSARPRRPGRAPGAGCAASRCRARSDRRLLVLDRARRPPGLARPGSRSVGGAGPRSPDSAAPAAGRRAARAAARGQAAGPEPRAPPRRAPRRRSGRRRSARPGRRAPKPSVSA